jgi:hypothetical protein
MSLFLSNPLSISAKCAYFQRYHHPPMLPLPFKLLMTTNVFARVVPSCKQWSLSHCTIVNVVLHFQSNEENTLSILFAKRGTLRFLWIRMCDKSVDEISCHEFLWQACLHSHHFEKSWKISNRIVSKRSNDYSNLFTWMANTSDRIHSLLSSKSSWWHEFVDMTVHQMPGKSIVYWLIFFSHRVPIHSWTVPRSFCWQWFR